MSINFWQALRAEVATMRGVHRNHEVLINLQWRYDRQVLDSSKRTTAREIADLLESQATLLEAKHHRLARATTSLPSPAEYRAEAANWRNGGPE